MDIRIFTEPQQGASYATLLAVARRSEDLGFSAFFRSDHFRAMGDADGLPGPSDAWTTLAGLARDTSRIRLGTLVSSATFRLPGPLAIAVANVDEMSGGRVEFGLGAGWFDDEHTGYGIPFPPLGERFDRLEEQLEIITGLWSTAPGESFDFAGEHFRVVDSPALPKPVQPGGPPIVIGGFGPRRTPALAARFAAEFNVPFADPDTTSSMNRVVSTVCEELGRDPATLVRSAAQVVCCGRDESEIARRASAIGREVDELRANGLAGTPSELVERIERFAEVGVDRIYLQMLDLDDLDQLDLIAAEVASEVGGLVR